MQITPACLHMHPEFETLATLSLLAARSQVMKPEIENCIWNASLEIGKWNGKRHGTYWPPYFLLLLHIPLHGFLAAPTHSTPRLSCCSYTFHSTAFLQIHSTASLLLLHIPLHCFLAVPKNSLHCFLAASTHSTALLSWCSYVYTTFLVLLQVSLQIFLVLCSYTF